MHEISTKQRTIYLRRLLQRYDTLSLPLGSGWNFSLIQVFQPLRLRSAHATKTQQHANDVMRRTKPLEEIEVSKETDEHEEALDVLAKNGLEALNKSPRGRMVILGGPGTGKTTVLKHLLCHHAHLALEESAAPLPIFLSLPDLARAGQSLDTYLAHISRDFGLEADDEQALSSALQHNQAFVCLDSLDEVLPRLRADIIHQINALAQGSGNTWIVGSRFTDYKGGQFQQGQFQEWELQTLDEPRRQQLAAQLLPELQRQLPVPAQPARTLNAPDYVQALNEHRQAATWGENPLLFSLGAVVYLRQGNLSGSRAMLYREVINALLETRESDAQRREQLRGILASVALELYQTKGRTFSLDELRSTLAQLCREQQATWNIEEILQRLLNAGLLDVVAYETYSFRHQTFQEYLVASALAQHLVSEDFSAREVAHDFVWSKRMYSRWSDILCFLVGILGQECGETGREVARRWLQALAAIRTQPAGDVGHLGLLLALRSLPELPFPVQETALTEIASELVVHWAEILIATARATGHSYQENPRLTRLRLLACDIRLLNQRIVQAGVDLLTSVFLDPGEDERVRDPIIHTIGALGGHAPLQALFACLREHHIPLVMTTECALQALANQFALEPVMTALLDPHEDWKVREQAAQMLGRSHKPEVVQALVQVAREDDSLACHAIDALALLGKAAPMDVLIDILRNDNGWSGWKRVHAARALGELGQESAIEALIDVLNIAQDQADAEIVEALIKLQATFPFEQLVAWLASKKRHLQWLAIEKLILLDEPVPARPLLIILRKRVKHDDYDQHKLRASALRLLNKQASLVPLQDLRRLLKENHWSLQDGLRQAFCLHGTAAPVNALLETLASDDHGRAVQSLLILEILQQDVPVDLLLTQYAHDGTGVGSLEATWGRALLQYGTRLPAETLITIACECAGHREDDEDEDMVESLGKLGDYTVDALLAKLPDYSVIDFGFLPKVAHAVYASIPEEQLLAALHTSEGDIYTAAGILAVTGEDRYVPLLLSLLEKLTAHPVGYCKILSALATFREHIPLAALLTALQHEYKGVRETAMTILRDVNAVIDVSQLVAPLQTWIITHQHDPERYTAWYAGDLVEALGLCREYAPIAFLITLLEDDKLYNEAGEALAAVGQYVPFEVFFTMLRFPKGFSHEYAIIGIGKQKERVPVDRLLTLLSLNRENDERVEHGNGEKSHDEGENNEDRDEDEEYQYIAEHAINALLELDEYASVDVLNRFLQHEDERVREGARKALAELETKDFRDHVIRHWLSYYDEHVVRQSVVESQVALGERAPFTFWIEALSEDSSDSLAVGAACVLERLARVVPAKIVALTPECTMPGIRLARLSAWNVLGQVDEIILAAQSDTNSKVRQRAIEILGELRDPAAIEPLTQLLRDEDNSRLLLAIVDALSTLGSAVPLEPLLESCGYREYESRDWCGFDREPGIAAAEALKQTHPEAFHAIVPLAEALVQGEPPSGIFASRTQSRIADAMGTIGCAGPVALATLTELLDWPYWQVRMKATQACGKIRRNIPDAAIQRLLNLRHDPQSRAVREAADEALAEILSLETGIEDD
ncbi:MAG: HEAT repeat domain-containing protein [Ktedonobacteraceae bacterium]